MLDYCGESDLWKHSLYSMCCHGHSQCLSFLFLPFPLHLPTQHIQNTLYSVLCHRYLCKRDSIDCASLPSFASQFSISGSDLRRTCSTLLCWCSASHARCPAIEANSSIKCDYDPSLSSSQSAISSISASDSTTRTLAY